MQPPIHVRRYRPGDAPCLVALFRDTIRRVNSRDYTPTQILAWAPDDLDVAERARQFAERCTFVAERDGQVVGFGELEGDGHVNRFYVHADHQRQGVGRALLAAIEAEAQKRRLTRLFTEASITARPFFESRGFLTLTPQTVVCRGVEFINYRMAKDLVISDGQEPSTP